MSSASLAKLIAIARAAHQRRYTANELCAVVGVSRATAYRMIGELQTQFAMVILADEGVEIVDYGLLNRDRL